MMLADAPPRARRTRTNDARTCAPPRGSSVAPLVSPSASIVGGRAAARRAGVVLRTACARGVCVCVCVCVCVLTGSWVWVGSDGGVVVAFRGANGEGMLVRDDARPRSSPMGGHRHVCWLCLCLLTSAGRSGGSARRPYDLPPPASSRTDLSPPSPHLGRQVGRQRLRQDVAAAARHRVQHVEREPPGGDEGLEVGRDRGRGRGRGRRRRRRHHDSRRRHQSLGSRHATPFAIGGAEGASTLKGKDDDDSTSCTTPTTPVWAAVKSQ